MSKAIQDNDLLYNALSPLVQFGCRCHYNSFVVRGTENLPQDGAYIIAPCHQQALMEPLAVLCFAPKPPVFLARADIFKKPTIRAILTFLKIMPVYRIRDGKDQLGQNQEIFDRCRDVLLDGFPLCLMAEGRHNNRHHLLPMGKGMFRIAGETQLALGDYPLYIVPTGIDFDDYEMPYSNLVVNIGKPIPVQPFMEKYKEDEPVALNEMRDALREALSPLMHDVRDEEHYDEIMALCKSQNREYRRREGLRNTAWNRFLMRQKITADYEKGVRVTGYGLEVKKTPWRPLLGVLLIGGIVAAAVLVPMVRWILLFCLVCYPLPFIPTHLIVKKMIADPQFRSSVNFGVRFLLSIVYAIVIGIVMACCGGAWMSNVADLGGWWGLVAIAWVPIAARLTAPAVNLLRFFFMREYNQ
jgi:1-acyl-sn-glycerol-3-phosphate acyltransferase